MSSADSVVPLLCSDGGEEADPEKTEESASPARRPPPAPDQLTGPHTLTSVALFVGQQEIECNIIRC